MKLPTCLNGLSQREMPQMPSKSKEELAEEWMENEGLIGKISYQQDVSNGFLAGYAAGLESPGLKEIIEMLPEIAERLETYGRNSHMGSPSEKVWIKFDKAYKAFQSENGCTG